MLRTTMDVQAGGIPWEGPAAALFKIAMLVVHLVYPGFALAQAPVDIGDRRELFVDHYMIESVENARLVLHRPRLEGVALRFDEPWEGRFSAYATVLRDRDRLRMYYRGLPVVTEPGTSLPAVTCYAESRDGISWTKPALRLFEVMGNRENNVVLADSEPFTHNFCPFIDTRTGVPDSLRYKAIAGTEASSLVAFVSGDGIRWRKWREKPIFTKGMFDSQNVAFWSASEGRYVLYFRTWTGERYTGYRTISRTTSLDFLNWTDPHVMDFGQTPPEHLYTNATQPYFRAPHIYLAMPKRFFPDKGALSEKEASRLVENPKYRAASSDAVLMSSRGGAKYDRTFMEAFMRPGPDPRDWVARDNTPALGIVPASEREMYLYRMSHYAQASSHLSRYSLRTDGFVSVTAPFAGGELTTRLLRFRGDALEINLATSPAGGVRVELLDADGAPIPGYTLADCPEMIGDQISRVVRWRSGEQLTQLAGKPVRLRFYLRDADLYSFRFAAAPEQSLPE